MERREFLKTALLIATLGVGAGCGSKTDTNPTKVTPSPLPTEVTTNTSDNLETMEMERVTRDITSEDVTLLQELLEPITQTDYQRKFVTNILANTTSCAVLTGVNASGQPLFDSLSFIQIDSTNIISSALVMIVNYDGDPYANLYYEGDSLETASIPFEIGVQISDLCKQPQK